MKILMYSVRDDEQDAIQAWAAAHQIQVDTNDLEFHPETADLVKGYDGLVIQQRSPIGGDASLYQSLAAAGLKQLTSRTAGGGNKLIFASGKVKPPLRGGGVKPVTEPYGWCGYNRYSGSQGGWSCGHERPSLFA